MKFDKGWELHKREFSSHLGKGKENSYRVRVWGGLITLFNWYAVQLRTKLQEATFSPLARLAGY